MSTIRPTPQAQIAGLLALVRNAAREDSSRRPVPALVAWQEELVVQLGAGTTPTRTNGELLQSVLDLGVAARDEASTPGALVAA